MYQRFKDLVIWALKVPPEPQAPTGEEGSLRVFRAAPNYFRYRLALWAIGAVIGGGIGVGISLAMIIGGLFAAPFGLLISLGGFALLALTIAQLAFSCATLRLDYEMRWYKVTDRSLRIREGVVMVREMTLTFANIQNISVSQGPLQRYFEIADLKVQTAGGGGAMNAEQQGVAFDFHTAYFRGVNNAEEIRDLMLERLRRLRDSGLGDLDEAHLAEEEAGAEAALPAAGPDNVLEALRALRNEARLLRQAAG